MAVSAAVFRIIIILFAFRGHLSIRILFHAVVLFLSRAIPINVQVSSPSKLTYLRRVPIANVQTRSHTVSDDTWGGG